MMYRTFKCVNCRDEVIFENAIFLCKPKYLCSGRINFIEGILPCPFVIDIILLSIVKS